MANEITIEATEQGILPGMSKPAALLFRKREQAVFMRIMTARDSLDLLIDEDAGAILTDWLAPHANPRPAPFSEISDTARHFWFRHKILGWIVGYRFNDFMVFPATHFEIDASRLGDKSAIPIPDPHVDMANGMLDDE
jgi:hypothetical protein